MFQVDPTAEKGSKFRGIVEPTPTKFIWDCEINCKSSLLQSPSSKQKCWLTQMTCLCGLFLTFV